MSFTRPGGPYAPGATLPSADVNNAWTDIVNALDKTTAGDTLSGAVTMAATSSIKVANAGAVIQAQVASGITASVAGGIASGAPSGIALTGGSNDWPTFGVAGASPRSYSKAWPLVYTSLATSWTNVTPVGSIASYGIYGGASGAAAAAQPILLNGLHNGATLASVAIIFYVGVSHANVPANLPTLAVSRIPITAGVGTAPSISPLSTSSPQSFTPTPASGAAWYTSGTIQALIYTCNQNNVIDTANYFYLASLVDENGANSATNNFYYAVGYSYTGITSLKFA